MESALDGPKDRFLQMSEKLCDVVVIGGGINGAAIARDASIRGLRVVLLEKSDFGAGASTHTTKLAHGGLRYLEQFDFSLVKESLYERRVLLKNAPHLVHPLPFILPVYSGNPYPLWLVNLGLYLYDYLAKSNGLPKHSKLSVEEVTTRFPYIQQKGLRGGCLYYDAQMVDNRLVIENILSAEKSGAIVLNYAEVVSLSRSQQYYDIVHFKNVITGQKDHIHCKVIVNATGAWSNQVAAMESNAECDYVAPTKGVHVVIPQISKHTALLLRAPQDGRVFFVLPWGNYSLLGTTDTFYDGDPDKVVVNPNDVLYLLEAFHTHFPGIDINESFVIASFAGLRPLGAHSKGKKSASAISRTHTIRISDRGVITVLGGKFTTHRKIAEDVVDIIVSRIGNDVKCLPCSTSTTPLPGAANSFVMEKIKSGFEAAGLDKGQIEHLLTSYGQLSNEILKIIQTDPSECLRVCPEYPHILAEVTYTIREEHAKRLADWFCRRTSIAYTPCHGIKCLRPVADKFSAILGWDQIRREKEMADFVA